MTIGLSKEEIIAKLSEDSELISRSLFEKIADVIIENNKLIEEQLGNKPPKFG